MKVPYNWLRQYVEIDLSPEELAERLTMSGIEVGDVSTFAPLGERVVTGVIETLQPHPRAAGLQMARVHAGNGYFEVACGAWNIKEGDAVALALPDARLPDGSVVLEKEIKGTLSQGMLLSARELALEVAQEEEGVLVLNERHPPGTPLSEALFLNQPVLELELTPNRADCLGLLGVAREVAALTGGRCSPPTVELVESGTSVEQKAGVEILDPELCPRYTARMVEGVQVKSSPLNLQLKLLSAGIRPINNIVDVTNYVMWETGHPMHAFDYDKLNEGRIIVRRAREGETLLTLDGVERVLDPEVLVIADAAEPVGLGGVMGGEHTEITAATRRVLLEAACFHPANIRRTARRLNLPSEASQRFEKGVDPEGVILSQDRAAELIQKLSGGEVLEGILDNHPSPYIPPVIHLEAETVHKVLGYRVEEAEMVSILEGLGLKVKEAEAEENRRRRVFAVEVPSHRRDLFQDVDLVEEVARVQGYHHIPSTLPQGVITSGRRSRRQQVLQRAREILTACGLHEIITFSFINPRFFDLMQLAEGDGRRRAVALQNPITEDQGVMRTTLVPGALQVMQHNMNRRVDDQQIFELGEVFMPGAEDEKLPHEREMICMAVTGRATATFWGEPPRQVDFYYLKGILQALLGGLGIGYELEEPREDEFPYLHPTRCGRISIKGNPAGVIGSLHPSVAEEMELRGEVLLAELEMEPILEEAALDPSYRELPRFPAVLRDAAFIIPAEVRASEMLAAIGECGGELLEEATLFDVYLGEQIPEGHKSLAFSMVFRHREKTLTDEEVDRIQNKLEEEMYRRFGAVLRKL